jgi:hypothetical protein
LRAFSNGKIFFYEDLTPMRSKLLYIVKNLGIVHHAYRTNGKIIAFLKDPGNAEKRDNLKKVHIENLDDLFKLGVDNIPYKDLGIYADAA